VPTLRTWLQLVRAPNLFTVPGDPLAGYLLASIPAPAFGSLESGIWFSVAASLCFYVGGLLLNDLADLAEDRRERPSRPLPSGAASRATVIAVMCGLFVLGLALSAAAGMWTLGVGIVLLLAIGAYNVYSKRLPVIGALNMGLCRGLSLLLGATAVAHGDLTIPLILRGRLDHLAIVFAMITLFIAAITHLARFETHESAPAVAKCLPAIALAAGIASFLPRLGGPNRPPTIALLTLALVISAHVGWELLRNAKQPLPPMIGQLIRLLLPIQAAFCAATGDTVGSLSAAVLILLWPVSRAVGQRYYAS
jgi:4-hydroxybenzoate polyprenyltransferase